MTGAIPGRVIVVAILLLAGLFYGDRFVVAGDERPAGYSGNTLGRLFLTPGERNRIDSMRAQGVTEEDTKVVATTEPRKAVERVVVNGLVRRSNGTDAVWVNGKKLDSQRPAADNVVLLRGPDNQQRVVVGRTDGGQARLKPGQRWDVSSGTIDECNGCDSSQGRSDTDKAQASGGNADQIEEDLIDGSAGGE